MGVAVGILQTPNALLSRLKQFPEQSVALQIGGIGVTASIVISDYGQCLRDAYEKALSCSIKAASDSAQIDFDFSHFGLLLSFDHPYQLRAHDQQSRLLGDIKSLVAEFGVLTLHNVCLTEDIRDFGHRNRFPHLNFHRDRNSSQPTPYSLYTRDPEDAEQQQPRISSTLFIANIVAYLQSLLEQKYHYTESPGVLSHYDIFHDSFMHPLLNTVMLEQKWDQPEGVGEVSVIDNRQVLHSSYCRRKGLMGYRIGVRYLS